MKLWLLGFFLVQNFACINAFSAEQVDPLTFSEPVVVHVGEKGTFPQIESSGRRSIAVSGDTVAVIWTASSKDTSTIYVAFQRAESLSFSEPIKISAASLAYEPSITGISAGRFLMGWEENQQAWLRIVSQKNMGAAVLVSHVPAKHVSVDSTGKNHVAVWAQGEGRHSSIYISSLKIEGHDLSISAPSLVDKSKNNHAEHYPVVELANQGRLVAWEDRRDGLTHILTAYAPAMNKPFESPALLNQFSLSPSPKFGRGSGAMRVALDSSGDHVVAAWLDKRNWRSGYDVFSSQSKDGGKTFLNDELAQDQFAENVPQWHVSIAMQRGGKIAAVAWDDERNDSPDVFYSLRKNDEWSDDFELLGGDGPGRQSHPSILFDQQGRLHAVWQTVVNGVTRVLYGRSNKVK